MGGAGAVFTNQLAISVLPSLLCHQSIVGVRDEEMGSCEGFKYCSIQMPSNTCTECTHFTKNGDLKRARSLKTGRSTQGSVVCTDTQYDIVVVLCSQTQTRHFKVQQIKVMT